MTKLMIVHEEHGDRYFFVKDVEDQNKVALKILRERENIGYYPTMEQISKDFDISKVFKEDELQMLDLSDKEIDALPEVVRKDLVKKRSVLQRRRSQFDADKEDALFLRNNLDKLLNAPETEALGFTFKTNRGKTNLLALWLLYIRSDYEYEYYTVQDVEEF